jgi:hypothetical protein
MGHRPIAKCFSYPPSKKVDVTFRNCWYYWQADAQCYGVVGV